MTLTRRDFLKAGAAAALACSAARVAARYADADLSPGVFDSALDPASPAKTQVWAFNRSLPGPTLRYRKGARLRAIVTNELPQETTVHWHGVRVPNAMDGVPRVTQNPIRPGQRFEYAFVLPDSGTFWYHPHQNSHEQVARGLYGALVVEEERPIAVDREEVWVLSDIKLGPDRRQVEDFGRILEIANEGRVGNRILLNGTLAGGGRTFSVRAGERIRLRLINAASARIFRLAFAAHAPLVIACDGQAVPPHPVPPGGLELGPGMRADLVLDCLRKPGETFVVSSRGHAATEIVRLAYRDEKPLRAELLPAPVAIEPNEIPEPDLKRATEHYLVFEGGMRGIPVIGMIDGKPAPIRDLMHRHGLAWTMNYLAQHEHAAVHEPLFELRRGEHVLLHLLNQTDFPHPMHLHGHFFRVVAVNGEAPPVPAWRDTAMVPARGTLDIAFVADNPGEWMFHCHILDHAIGGMMGTIVVE
jgi:FtsP/CotA-like multicopper oxidase with cupredoxin domain